MTERATEHHGRLGRRRVPWACVVLTLLAGCSEETKPGVATDGDGEQVYEPSVTARDVRQEPTPDTCRTFLQELNARPQEVEITPEFRKLLVERLRLSPEEVAEVVRPEFTALDGHHLADALLFADATAALDVARLTPAEQAREAMAWVTRNVFMTSRTTPPAPPKYVALRGSGDALERSYVYLAMLEQLGIPGCLIGPADAVDRTAEEGSPFWAVGALVGKDPETLLMFDPSTGEEWEPAGDQKPTLFLSPPLSSLAPRMDRLGKQVRDSLKASLAVDPVEIRDRFAKASAGEVEFWNPPEEPGTLTRALHSFVPVEEGGMASEETGTQARFQLGLIPAAFYPEVFNRLDGTSQAMVFGEFATPFVVMVLSPEGAADAAVRGDYTEAVRMLTEVRDRARQGLRGTQTIDVATIESWCDEVNRVMAQRNRARREGDAMALQQAEQRLASLLLYLRGRPGQEIPPPSSQEDAADRAKGRAAAELLQTVQAEAASLLATFRLAVCMQEQAEWRSLRARTAPAGEAEARRAEARSAWRTAADWWSQYVNQFSQYEEALPDRMDHARRMLERSKEMAK